MSRLSSISRRLFLGLTAITGLGLFAGQAVALSPEPAPLPQRMEIKVGVQDRAGFLAPLEHIKGILDKLNITYVPVAFQRYADARAALLTGAIDIGAMGATHIIQNVASGGDTIVGLRGLAAMELYPVVREGVKVDKWADLKGKKVGLGVGGNVWTTFVSKLQEEGVSYKDIQAIGIQGSGRNFVIALQRGDVDVIVSWSPFTEMAVVEKAGKLAETLEFGNTQALGSDQGMWATTRAELESKRALIERFLWAYAKAEEITNATPESKLKTIIAFSGQEPAVAELTAKWTKFGAATSLDQMEKMAKLLFDLGLIQSDVSAKMKSHFDPSIANAIQGK